MISVPYIPKKYEYEWRIGKEIEAVVVYFKLLTQHRHEGTDGNHEDLSYDSRSASQDSNNGHVLMEQEY
jgi:hypothetical protein